MPEFPSSWSGRKVVFSHDWLNGMRGGERVLEVLCKGFPQAPIYTLIYRPEAVSPTIADHTVYTSRLQNWPFLAARYRYFLPCFPFMVEQFRPGPADLLISTSHCVAKGIRSGPGTRHLCYCFTPMRYAWLFYEEYFGRNPVKKLLLRPLLARLRRWDRAVSVRVDRFVAISAHVQRRIHAFYGRDSDIVYPPVDTERCTPGPSDDGEFDLVVSALVPYKRVDLAVRAYAQLPGRRLVVVGVGTDQSALQRIAPPNVTFLGWQTDDAVLDLYRRCRLLVFPGEEDFGIVPLEAQACGRPVVAYGCGGVLETVRDGETGIHFHAQTPDCLADAVNRCGATTWDRSAIRRHAEKFSVSVFIAGMESAMLRVLS